MKPPMRLFTAEGRRAAAFFAIVCGCGVMTAYAAVVLYLVRNKPELAFWLGMAAHAQLAIGFTGLIALFVKRTVKVGREGIEITDAADPTTVTMTAEVKK